MMTAAVTMKCAIEVAEALRAAGVAIQIFGGISGIIVLLKASVQTKKKINNNMSDQEVAYVKGYNEAVSERYTCEINAALAMVLASTVNGVLKANGIIK